MDKNVLKLAQANGTLRDYYEQMIERKIRQRYSLSQELSINRRRYSRPEEFEIFNKYVDWCISTVKDEFKELGYDMEVISNE